MNNIWSRALLRDKIAGRLPKPARQALHNLRDFLNGPSIEERLVKSLIFQPDFSKKPRVTFILPSLASANAYGGINTALDICEGLANILTSQNYDFRILSMQNIDSKDNILKFRPKLTEFDAEWIGKIRSISLRSKEICIVYNWWISHSLTNAIKKQSSFFHQRIMPRVHLLQDYEPGFYPYSTAHLLAHEAVGLGEDLWVIFNTSQLHSFWKRQGHLAAKEYQFEPVINSSIRPFLTGIKEAKKQKLILVYGRPKISRNVFSIIEKGLKEWGSEFGRMHQDWRFFSAGEKHDDIIIGGGHTLKCLGKISLEQYGNLLRDTSIGISLMSSPHPSYPPIEMAHFGALVLTNGYTDKKPSEIHKNLHALPDLSAETFSSSLETLINLLETEECVGLSNLSSSSKFLLSENLTFLHDLVSDIKHLYATLNSTQ